MSITNTVATNQVSDDTRRSISTPDRVDTRLGTLSFVDGAPTPETSALLFDHLDITHAIQAFDDNYRATSIAAIRNGFAGRTKVSDQSLRRVDEPRCWIPP